MPKVTVIMPAYNAEAYIGGAIRSVRAQGERDWELLVIDDGSGDGTWAAAVEAAGDDERIRLLKNPENMGAAATRNRGLDLAQGEYVAFLDCDDLWAPEKLERQWALLDRTGGDLCYSGYRLVDETGAVRRNYPVPAQVSYEALLRENVIGCSTVVLRRSALGDSRFDSAYFHEDYVLWLTLLSRGCRAVGCTEFLADWRYRPDSRSFSKGNAARQRWRIYRRYLKLPLWKSLWYFGGYALAGLKKYGKT